MISASFANKYNNQLIFCRIWRVKKSSIINIYSINLYLYGKVNL